MPLHRSRALAIATLSILIVSNGGRASADAPSSAACSGGAAFAAAASGLTSLDADRDATPAGLVRRSLALDAIAGGTSAVAEAGVLCRDAAPAAATAAVARANVLRLWARTIALRALEAPIYPAPYDPACHPYDLASVRLDAQRAWSDRDDAQGTAIAPDALEGALDVDPLYPRVAELAVARLGALGVRALPNRAWLFEASANLDADRAALPAGEHCGPTLALFGVEPETAAFAPLRHRADGAELPSASVAAAQANASP